MISNTAGTDSAGAATLSVQVNGEPRALPTGSSVADLAAALGLPDTGVAIAVGDDVIPAGRWAATALVDGAEVDVLTAVQGG
ncbi:sulfur carrier protein ThiS [Dietzia sp.]|uniref:sulfur carrier protein ThiS n=1 Tax=Dietzia sp. TaxID=1871616 RepID=UPI002FDB3AB3